MLKSGSVKAEKEVFKNKYEKATRKMLVKAQNTEYCNLLHILYVIKHVIMEIIQFKTRIDRSPASFVIRIIKNDRAEKAGLPHGLTRNFQLKGRDLLNE